MSTEGSARKKQFPFLFFVFFLFATCRPFFLSLLPSGFLKNRPTATGRLPLRWGGWGGGVLDVLLSDVGCGDGVGCGDDHGSGDGGDDDGGSDGDDASGDSSDGSGDGVCVSDDESGDGDDVVVVTMW